MKLADFSVEITNPNQSATSETDSITLTQSLDIGLGTLTMISNHREIEKTIMELGVGEWVVVIHQRLQQLNLLDVINNRSEKRC